MEGIGNVRNADGKVYRSSGSGYGELTKALVRFGYGIENNPRGDFEIRGVSQELIGRFSKRHQEIDRKTRELLAKEPEKAGRNINAIRDHIAHKERARKIKDVGFARLQSLWNGQLSSAERVQLTRLDRNPPLQPDAPKMTAAEAVTWAEDHCLAARWSWWTRPDRSAASKCWSCSGW